MKHMYLLASLAFLLGWANMANAQASLGSPRVPGQEIIEPPAIQEAAALKQRSCFPLFSHVKRTRFTPLRNAFAHLFPTTTPPPPPQTDVPTREDIGRMIGEGWHSPAEISAAKIKLDESQSRFRCAAVRYLATIDCHYYPEAELGLIAALRADRVETVRFEAAQAMGQCPSVTLRMTEALQLTAQGFDTDGNPSETSERVRQAARAALQRQWTLMMPPTMNEPPLAPGQPRPEWYLQPQPAQPTQPTIETSSYLVEERQRAATVSAPAPSPPASPRGGPRSLYEYWTKSANTPVAETPRVPHEYPTPKTAQAPATERLRGPQSWYEFITSKAIGRDLFTQPAPTPENAVATRMRGLRPLGSEMTLAIPTTSLSSR